MKFRHSCGVLKERALEVAPEVRSWISDIIMSEATADAVVVHKPDHSTTLTVRLAPGEKPQLMVMGPRTRALYYRGAPGPSCLQVRLRPGIGKALFGRSMRDLVDEVVPLSDVWHSAGQMADLVDDPGMFVEALVEGLPDRDADGDLVMRAMDMLSTSDIKTSAKRLHVSERHLRNVFVDGVGVPPKRFARIARVRTVIEHGATRPLSELAQEAGFYDHSHMTAEFRAIMGVPPTVFFGGGASPNVRCVGPFKSVELPAGEAVT